MPKQIDVLGHRYERWLVIAEPCGQTGTRRKVLCRCDCGQERLVDPRYLRLGKSKSCGCLQKEMVGKASSARWRFGSRTHQMYNTWVKMKSRCYNKNDAKFPIYGGRGISVCDEWKSNFEVFSSDMGEKPTAGHTLDRLDNNGPYSRDNCRWATAIEQSRNKRNHRLVEHNGAKVPLSQACAETGINYRAALYRLNRGKAWMPLPTPPKG